jgi:hypothetical protein
LVVAVVMGVVALVILVQTLGYMVVEALVLVLTLTET